MMIMIKLEMKILSKNVLVKKTMITIKTMIRIMIEIMIIEDVIENMMVEVVVDTDIK